VPKSRLVPFGTSSTSTAQAPVDNLTRVERLAFACSLDRAAFSPCRSRVRLRNLRPGRHQLAVRATAELGNTDATPARLAWRVVPRPKL
jgi:hypothetical protein